MPAVAVHHSHVNEESILDYVEGRAAGENRERIEEHLDACDECRQLVAELAQTSLIEGDARWHEGTPTEPHNSALPKPGARLADRFRIVKALGHGATGLVYEAFDEALGINVAIKVFWPTLASDDRVVESIRREASLGRRIFHPNVRRVFDVGASDGVTFLTMELIEGETLEERLKRGRVTEAEAISMMAQVCDALTAAHAAGIVHRDLKPGNIALDRAGRVIVMDFGLARDINAQASRRQGRGLVGTPAYWSPEQSRGEAATAASDIYSLGLIAYVLLSGESFSLAGGNQLPPPFRSIVDRCLEQQPQRRFASADAVRVAIVGARRSRVRWITIGAATVVVSTALASVGAIRVLRPPAQPPSVSAATQPPSQAQPALRLEPVAAAANDDSLKSIPIDARPLSSSAAQPTPPVRVGAPRRSEPPRTIAGTSTPAASSPSVDRPLDAPASTQRKPRSIDRDDPYGAP